MNPYSFARQQFADYGIDTEIALATLANIPVSLHCWQGDDVRGFEDRGTGLDGGLAVTGNHPGAARDIDELRADLDQALALIPGPNRLNLHAIYGDFRNQPADRDAIGFDHFAGWVDWCRERGLGMDFNPTFFAHPKAADGYTLGHRDPEVRAFWVEHGRACRRIAAEAGRRLGTPVVCNVWIPDGSKDMPADRSGPRRRLEESLDALFADPLNPAHVLDAVESKLFGIGSESYVVGSHEFYLGYTVKKQILYCLDMGHFHPTESAADKISALLAHLPGLLLHISRGVRWDSDHVVLFDDPTRAVAEEVVRGGFCNRVHVGLDYFDASINRVAAWVLGARNARKAFLAALLQPNERLKTLEEDGDFTGRLVLMEEARTLPIGAVWSEYCRRHNTPEDGHWLPQVTDYEKRVLETRIRKLE